MSHEILFREQYAALGTRRIYVKPPGIALLPLLPNFPFMPLRRFKKIRRDWYGIKHISLWPLLMLLIYWMKHKYQKKNTGGLLDASEEVVPELSHSKLDQNSVVQLGSSLTLSTTLYERFVQFFHEVFLPQGYPDSVSDDYYRYQLWDTLQAFCSTITGTLTTQAVMRGVGVGDTAATPFAAAVTWILKDGTGMVGRITFAWIEGTRLDGNCKKWRLFADILNDMAMALELLVPMFLTYSTHILCIATALKSIVGVAGGATRAAITQHQAIRNNMADVSAKDGSQETFVNLCASAVGIIILATFDEGKFVWHLFTIFTVIHLYANYQAVLSLKMVTLNNARLNLLLQTYLGTEMVSSPEVVNRHEAVILGTGLSDLDLCGFRIILGASLQNAMACSKVSVEDIRLLAHYYHSKRYLIVVDTTGRRMFVSLLRGETAVDVIQGYFHAVILGIAVCIIREHPLRVLNTPQSKSSPVICPVHRLQEALVNLSTTDTVSRIQNIPMVAMMAADDVVSTEFPDFIQIMQKQGWNTGSHHITVDEWRGEWSFLDKKEKCYFNKKYVTPNKTVSFSDS